MEESSALEISLLDIHSSTLQLLVSYMYGSLRVIADRDLLPLFTAADRYQVGWNSLRQLIICQIVFLHGCCQWLPW